MKSLEVKTGESLAAILKAFPGATVQGLMTEPNQDCWRVHIPEETDIRGPVRVVVETEGDDVTLAVPPSEAAERYNINPDFILIRDDGWSLGFRKEDETAALKLWAGKWVAMLLLATGGLTRINPDTNKPINERKRRTGPKPIKKKGED